MSPSELISKCSPGNHRANLVLIDQFCQAEKLRHPEDDFTDGQIHHCLSVMATECCAALTADDMPKLLAEYEKVRASLNHFFWLRSQENRKLGVQVSEVL